MVLGRAPSISTAPPGLRSDSWRAFDGMFSFFPCTPLEERPAGFPRPCIAMEQVTQKKAMGFGARSSRRQRTPAAVARGRRPGGRRRPGARCPRRPAAPARGWGCRTRDRANGLLRRSPRPPRPRERSRTSAAALGWPRAPSPTSLAQESIGHTCFTCSQDLWWPRCDHLAQRLLHARFEHFAVAGAAS